MFMDTCHRKQVHLPANLATCYLGSPKTQKISFSHPRNFKGYKTTQSYVVGGGTWNLKKNKHTTVL